jgi:3-dehydroquinate synthetase
VRLGAPQEVYEVTKRLLVAAGLPTAIPSHYDTDAIMKAMMHDKKFTEGTMLFVVPTAVGKVELNPNVSAAMVREIVDELKREADRL